MGKTIDILRESFDKINAEFEIKCKKYIIEGRILTPQEQEYVNAHLEMSLLLNVKRPNISLIATKLKQIKDMGNILNAVNA
jgi:hypothetical protein